MYSLSLDQLVALEIQDAFSCPPYNVILADNINQRQWSLYYLKQAENQKLATSSMNGFVYFLLRIFDCTFASFVSSL